MCPRPEPTSDSDKSWPYAISFATGIVLALVYVGIRQLHFGCNQDDGACTVISDLFFGWRGTFVGFVVVLGWIATSVIAPSVLNQLRPHTSWWVRGLLASGVSLLGALLIIAVLGGILTYSSWG